VDDIWMARELLTQGFDHADLARLRRTGELRQVRRGAYERVLVDPETTLSIEQRHRRQIAATAPQLESGAVVSHASAAVVHGLPVWGAAVERVHVTRSRSYGAKRRHLVEVHCAPVTDADRTVHDGVLVTSVARTVIDLARSLPFEQAVAAGDQALRLGVTPAELDGCLAAMPRWPHVRQARRVLAFLDVRSESVGESVSRVRIRDEGLPDPELQREIRNGVGAFIARVDFCWDEHQIIGEFDGRVKYGRLLPPGKSLEDAIYAEKIREDALRDLGWRVVRWTWADLYTANRLRDRLDRALHSS
jgi:hypothetical protein